MVSKKLTISTALLCFALLLSACSGKQSSADNPQSTSSEQLSGEAVFQKSCEHCHGANAKGLTGLGPNLITSEFVQTQTDEELLAFIIQGRPVTDPDNTTGIPMPPRGGNPNLPDAQILDIITWIRSLEAGVVPIK